MKIISETDVTGGNIVLSDANGDRERGRERRLNEPSIAASGYMVIIARLMSVADNDDEDEREKLKRISPNCRPLVHSLGSRVVCHRRSSLGSLFLSLSDIDVESERSSERIRAETIRTLIELHKEKKGDRGKLRDRKGRNEKRKHREKVN